MKDSNGNGLRSFELSERAMKVSLSISMWTARRLDKKITRQIAEEHGMGIGIGRYNKCLLIEDINGTPAKEFKAIGTAANWGRNAHYEQTTPWGDQGERLCTNLNFIHWGAAMREAKDKFLDARAKFIAVYPQLVAQSKHFFTLMEAKTGKTMWNPKAYPTQAQIERKFRFATEVEGLSTAEDFRSKLADGQIKAIQEQIEATTARKVEIVNQELFECLGDLAKRVAHLGDPKSTVQKALAQDVTRITQVASRLNVTGNTYIDAFASRIAKELSFTPDMLKQLPEEREALAARASQVIDDMAAFMQPLE